MQHLPELHCAAPLQPGHKKYTNHLEQPVCLQLAVLTGQLPGWLAIVCGCCVETANAWTTTCMRCWHAYSILQGSRVRWEDS